MTRHQFIPVRKSDIVATLAEDPCGGPDAFADLCRLLGLTLHYEFFDEREQLKEAYFPFDPRIAERRPATDADYAAFLSIFRRVLAAANFTEIDRAEVDHAYRERGLQPVAVEAPLADYRDIRFFRRGRHRERVEKRAWFGLRKEQIEGDVYTDVVLVAASRPVLPEARGRHRRMKRPPPGAVFLKYFHGIASADLNTLLPDVRVMMTMRDRWFIGVPALFAAVPLLLKLGPTLAVLFFIFAGIKLGYTGAVEDDQMKQALAVLSGLVALGSFCFQQWVKYQRTALRAQLAIKDSIYFRNVNNNAGVFDALVGAAEEQEFKEAILAYWFLHREPCDKATLDHRIEAWIRERFGLDVDFEVDDGVAKLERFGLLVRDGDHFSVVEPAEALHRLDLRWDGYFRFAPPLAATG